MTDEPLFPITLRHSSGEQTVLDDRDEICWNLEWFDSNDKGVAVFDQRGRRVHLVVEGLRIVRFELQ